LLGDVRKWGSKAEKKSYGKKLNKRRKKSKGYWD